MDLPPAMPAASAEAVDGRRASPRKRVQVAAFAAMVGRVGAKGSRVVDVGSGHGHLTRHLVSALGVDAEGWERDPDRVAVASSLAGEGGARFVAMDARTLRRRCAATDLVVGLHACGDWATMRCARRALRARRWPSSGAACRSGRATGRRWWSRRG
nr:methyltransferase [Deltaproteobacteria bacterium]